MKIPKCILKLAPAATLLATLSSGTAFAAPLSPSAVNIANRFSAAVQDAFTLLADTDNPNLVYYVPRRGGIAVQGARTENPVPRFSILERTPSFGLFAGMPLTHIGGSFSTTSDQGALQQLQNEAELQGLSITPAPAQTAETIFMATGTTTSDGRIDVACSMESLTITNSRGEEREISVPKCNLRSAPESAYDVDSNMMYRFTALPAVGGSVVAQDIPFQAVTLPDWGTSLRALMSDGAQWDSLLTSEVKWKLKTSNLTRQARVHVQWKTLFEQASAFAAFHNFACIDIEVKAFFQRVVTCSREEECGVRVEYLNNGVWTDVAPNDAAFVNVVNAVQDRLQRELFNEIRAATTSQLGNAADGGAGSGFTLRANYEKIMREGYEVVPVTFNPGPEDVQARTTLNISCLIGGFENGRVQWNMEDPGCRAILGQ